MDTLKNYETRDIYLATILKQSGINLIKCENQSGRGIFVFENSEKIDEIVRSYFNDKLKTNPRKTFDTWKSLKSMAFSCVGNVR